MDAKLVALTAKRMTDARAILVRDNPFFGHLALGLQLSCAPCGTACTDGERLYFDPEFACQCRSNQEMEFVILHEVLHCVLEHCTRGANLNREVYNIACDTVVNSTILEMWGMSTFYVAGEEVTHLAPDGKEGREYTAEEIYQMLLSDHPQLPQAATMDRHDVWQTIRQKERIQDRWNNRIKEAAAACEGTAGMPSSVRNVADILLGRSKVDWKQLLHDFVQHDTFDYSFLPPDRRFSDGDWILPGFEVDPDQGTVHDLWVCVDSSGSITDDTLSDAMREIRDAMRQTGLTGAISFFDTNITVPQTIETEEELCNIIPKGGGGTNFHVIFRYLQEEFSGDLPKAILIFTDGYVLRWPREEAAMGIPVLWLISKGGNTRVPWGKVAQL